MSSELKYMEIHSGLVMLTSKDLIRYKYLLFLNMSHNLLHTFCAIDKDISAFSKQQMLQNLDLSSNFIKSVDGTEYEMDSTLEKIFQDLY